LGQGGAVAPDERIGSAGTRGKCENLRPHPPHPHVAARYAGWDKPENAKMLGKMSLEECAARVGMEKLDPQPRSARQEYLENVLNRYM
jgi:hypothetical protein